MMTAHHLTLVLCVIALLLSGTFAVLAQRELNRSKRELQLWEARHQALRQQMLADIRSDITARQRGEAQ